MRPSTCPIYKQTLFRDPIHSCFLTRWPPGHWNLSSTIFNLIVLALAKLPSAKWHWTLLISWTTLVQVLPWGRQAAKHYLSQCWPGPVLSYGVTMGVLFKLMFWIAILIPSREFGISWVPQNRIDDSQPSPRCHEVWCHEVGHIPNYTALS